MMCKYFDRCPSRTAICYGSEPSEECVFPILAAYEMLKNGSVKEYQDGPLTIVVPNRD